MDTHYLFSFQIMDVQDLQIMGVQDLSRISSSFPNPALGSSRIPFQKQFCEFVIKILNLAKTIKTCMTEIAIVQIIRQG